MWVCIGCGGVGHQCPLIQRLYREDNLSPGVEGQPGQHSKPRSQRNDDTGEIAQLLRFLLGKHEAPRSGPSIHIKSWGWGWVGWYTLAILL